MSLPLHVNVLASSFVAASILLGPSLARADEAAPAPSAPPSTTGSGASPPEDAPKPTRWYGFETLAVDGAALAMSIPAIAANNAGMQTGFLIATTLAYGLGGPIVHFTHGQLGKGFLDLGMRLALPFATGLLGFALGASSYQAPSCSPGASCGLGNAFAQLDAEAEGVTIGGLLGIAGAVTVDAVVLAREPIGGTSGAHEPEPAPVQQAFTSRIEPALGLVPERQGGARAMVGLVGTF
jgi:hypothetical protein